MLATFYTDKLYPLQDEVLNIVSANNTSFYLTGGTALSRHYLHHRFSDDLDFFTNNNPHFEREVKHLLSILKKNFTLSESVLDASYVQLTVLQGETRLKIEFINDVDYHDGELVESKLFKRIDSWQNILSNKITALGRNEAKDIADIVLMANEFKFNWRDVIDSAKQKDLWVEEISVSQAIHNFPIEALTRIKWITPPDFNRLAKDQIQIAKDILLGTENSLAATK